MSSSVEVFKRLRYCFLYMRKWRLIHASYIELLNVCVDWETAPYVSETLKLNSGIHSRNTRYANLNFICPKFKRKTEVGRPFSVAIMQLWNFKRRKSSFSSILRLGYMIELEWGQNVGCLMKKNILKFYYILLSKLSSST